MKQSIQPIKTDTRISWPSRLKSLEISGKIPVDILNSSTVRQAISKLHNETSLKFETKKQDSSIVVTRIN